MAFEKSYQIGAVSVAIFKSEKGYMSYKVSKSEKKEGATEYTDSNFFFGDDLLKLKAILDVMTPSLVTERMGKSAGKNEGDNIPF